MKKSKKAKKVEIDPIVKDYSSQIKDETLWYLRDAVFISRPVGYLYDLFEILASDRELNSWLSNSRSCDDLFSKIDQVESAVMAEIEARQNFHEQKRKEVKEAKDAKETTGA